MNFNQYLSEAGAIKPMYNDIMDKIKDKYGDVEFENSMGSLLVKKDGVNIGLINRKSIDKWEEIIGAKLKDMKTKKVNVASEPKELPKGYKPSN